MQTSPRGLQLHLGDLARPHMVDTLVMSNLAYFQLKAAPGRWMLSLAPGRTRQLYTLDPASLTSSSDSAAVALSTSPADGDGEAEQEDLYSTQVVISSLSGETL